MSAYIQIKLVVTLNHSAEFEKGEGNIKRIMTIQRQNGPINRNSHLSNLIFANILTLNNQLIRTRAIRTREKSAEMYNRNIAWSGICSYIKGAVPS